MLSDGDADNPAPLYRLPGRGEVGVGLGGLELSSVTWFGPRSCLAPALLTGGPSIHPCAPPASSLPGEETNSAQPHPAIHPGAGDGKPALG